MSWEVESDGSVYFASEAMTVEAAEKFECPGFFKMAVAKKDYSIARKHCYINSKLQILL